MVAQKPPKLLGQGSNPCGHARLVGGSLSGRGTFATSISISVDYSSLITNREWFNSIMLDVNTLLYFTASWCVPCKRFAPVMEAARTQLGANVEKIDIDEAPLTADYFGVKSVPTVIMIDENKKELARTVGAIPLVKVAAAFNL